MRGTSHIRVLVETHFRSVYPKLETQDIGGPSSAARYQSVWLEHQSFNILSLMPAMPCAPIVPDSSGAIGLMKLCSSVPNTWPFFSHFHPGCTLRHDVYGKCDLALVPNWIHCRDEEISLVTQGLAPALEFAPDLVYMHEMADDPSIQLLSYGVSECRLDIWHVREHVLSLKRVAWALHCSTCWNVPGVRHHFVIFALKDV